MIFVNDSNDRIRVYTYNTLDLTYAYEANHFWLDPKTLVRFKPVIDRKLRLLVDDDRSREIRSPQDGAYADGALVFITSNHTVTAPNQLYLEPIPQRPPSAPGPHTLQSGQGLQIAATDQVVTSPNGAYELALTTKGEFLFRKTGGATVWASGARGVELATFQNGTIYLQDQSYNIIAKHSGIAGESTIFVQTGQLSVLTPKNFLVYCEPYKGVAFYD